MSGNVRTSPRLRPSTDRYPEERQHCDGTTSGLSLEWCDVRLVDWVSFEGADANMVPIGDDETLETTRHRASRVTEGCGPGGVYPFDL